MFGLDKIGSQTVEEAHVAVNDVITKLSPLFRDIENRAGGILHGLLDRIECECSFKFKINPVPKAEPVPEDQQ